MTDFESRITKLRLGTWVYNNRTFVPLQLTFKDKFYSNGCNISSMLNLMMDFFNYFL